MGLTFGGSQYAVFWPDAAIYERCAGEIVHEYVHDISVRLEAVDLCGTGCLSRWDATDISYVRPLRPPALEERLYVRGE